MAATNRDLREVPASELRLLQIIFDSFAKSAEWPLVGELQHGLDRSGEELDIATVGARINRVLGHVDAVSFQGRAQLTIHGIALCAGGEAVLADLLCLVRHEHQRWLADGMEARLASDELAVACGMDALRLRRTRALMDRLPGWQSISGGPAGDWTVQMSMEIRRFKDVETVGQLLAAAPMPGFPESEWPYVAVPEPSAQVASRSAVFISCAEARKQSLAYPLRDLLDANGVRGFIVSDLPRLGDAWTPEEKVTAYMGQSQAVIALATPELAGQHGEFHPRSNIADEIARARTMGHLQDRICVLKEHTTQLPSNIAPAYESLDLDNPEPAFGAALKQLRAWEFEIPDPPRPVEPVTITPEISQGLSMLQGLAVENLARTQKKVLEWLTERTRPEQAQLVSLMVEVATSAPRWEDRSVAGHVLESMAVIDSSLLQESLLDELSRHPDSSIRSSVAVILFERAVRNPGAVPLNVVARLAESTSTDALASSWYVYTPARRCLSQLALTRQEVWDVVREMASSRSAEMRDGAASIVVNVAMYKPAAVPRDLVAVLRQDPDKGVRRSIGRVRKLLSSATKDERRRPYSPFSPF